MFTICLGGDIVPTKGNERLFCDGDGKALLGEELLAILDASDANIFNLESPLCDKFFPIDKCGPNLHAPSACVNGLKAMHVTALGCANNHTLDQGAEAMFHTRDILQQQGIDVFGIGENVTAASQPYIISKDGKRVGVYACAEHEFTIATETNPGANPYDALYSFDHVAELKAECDYVIVMFHGGKEYYRYPSPDIQRICRRLVEKGADLVVTQHTHCIGCREDYQDGVIVYGQGNFLFEQSNFGNRDFYTSGLLLRLTLDTKIEIEEMPVVLQENGCLSLAKGEIMDEILGEYRKRGAEIKQKGFISNKYREFALTKIENYLRIPLGMINDNLLYRCLNVLSGRKLHNLIMLDRHLLMILNIVECEAHRELWINGIKEKLRI